MTSVLTAAFAGGVTANVAVESRRSRIGPIRCAGPTVQPAGAFSSTVPRSSVPLPERTCTVASNALPGARKKSDSSMCSSVPRGSPPGSRFTAP